MNGGFIKSLIRAFYLLLVCAMLALSLATVTNARFLTPDTWDPILAGVDFNRYAYGANDPVNQSDANGHSYGSDDPGGTPDNIGGKESEKEDQRQFETKLNKIDKEMREDLAGPQNLGPINFGEYYKGTGKGPVNAVSDFTTFATRGKVNIPKFEAGTGSEALGMSNGVAIMDAIGLRGAKAGGVATPVSATESAAKAGVKGIASEIDRAKFKQQREGFWKTEAKMNPSKYSKEDLQRMDKGRAPIGPDGKPIELHHEGGTPNGGVVPMTQTDHRIGPNYLKNHPWMGH